MEDEHEFFRGASAALQQALQNWNERTLIFQKRADFPKFKKKVAREFPSSARLRGRQPERSVKVPKMGWMRYRKCGGAWGSEEHHYQRIRWQVVRVIQRAEVQRAAPIDVSGRYGLGRSQLRNPIQRAKS